MWIVLLLSLGVASGIQTKPRSCCKYGYQDCPSENSCSLRGVMSNQTIYPGLEQCSVLKDSKRDKKKCLDEDFIGTEILTVPFHVNAYILDDKLINPNLEAAIFGLELALPYGVAWTEAKFKLVRSQGCGVDCRPRLVRLV